MDATNYFKCSKVSNPSDKTSVPDTEAFFFNDRDAQSIAVAYAAVQAHAAYLRGVYKKEPRIVVYRRPEIGGAWSGRYAVVGESFGGSVDVV